VPQRALDATFDSAGEYRALIDSLFNPFRCKHARTTFPMSPVRKKSFDARHEAATEMYVVCLDCGKQFSYDWENMRIGKAVDISGGPALEEPPRSKIPFRTKSKLRYLLWGSALSAILVLGKAAKSRKARTGGEDHGETEGGQNPQKPRSS
jgi:hypothetical protein